MPQAIAGIAPILSKVAGPALTGVGLLSNFLQGRKENTYADSQMKLQKEMEALMNNPAELMRREKQFQQPLSGALRANVGNQTQAFLAERGLSASPSLAAAVQSQALAPYEQNEQQLAMQALFRSLGLPFQGQPPNFGPKTDLTGMLKYLLPQSGSGSTPAYPGGVPAGQAPIEDSFVDPWIAQTSMNPGATPLDVSTLLQLKGM